MYSNDCHIIRCFVSVKIVIPLTDYSATHSFKLVVDWLTDYLTNSTEQIPSWEANSHSASQEIPRLVWKQEVQYRVHKSRHWPLSWARWIQLTPWNIALLEKLTVTQLVKTFPAFYGSRRYIIIFTRAHYWSLSWSRRIQLTNSMEQSPSWEANSHSGSPEISRLLLNPNVHYRAHKGPELVPILSHIHPVHTLPPYFPKIRCNIIFPPTPRSSK
jgi:hypothetical protein